LSRLDVLHKPLRPKAGNVKGKCERRFRILSNKLKKIKGYASPNRYLRRDWNPEECPTMAELELALETIQEEINTSEDKFGKSPFDRYLESCIPREIERKELAVMLDVMETRALTRPVINYMNAEYRNDEKLPLIAGAGAEVTIRAPACPYPPFEIEVLHDGNWICTASRLPSPTATEDIVQAKKLQGRRYRESVDAKIKAVEQIERQLGLRLDFQSRLVQKSLEMNRHNQRPQNNAPQMHPILRPSLLSDVTPI
jgi:hypothetical protein